MGEKRFVYGRTMPFNSVEDLLPCITDKETENVYVRMSDIVNLLNELNDENEQLRQELKWKKEEIKTLLEEDDNDDSFIGNWTDKPVILERKPHRFGD